MPYHTLVQPDSLCKKDFRHPLVDAPIAPAFFTQGVHLPPKPIVFLSRPFSYERTGPHERFHDDRSTILCIAPADVRLTKNHTSTAADFPGVLEDGFKGLF
jgi:hypothetical protein